jgi:hypothetical protein
VGYVEKVGDRGETKRGRNGTGRRKDGRIAFFTVRVRNVGGWIGTHDVLVRIHVYFEAILFAFPQYLDSVVHEVIVVDPTTTPSVERPDNEG